MRAFWIAALILSAPHIADGRQDPLERMKLEKRATLAGLRGVRVIVEDISGEAGRDASRQGLTTSTLQTDMELRVRQAGIRVLEQSEMAETPGNPVLTLQIALLPLSTAPGLYSFDIHLEFEQVVQLARAPKTRSWAITWSTTGEIGVVGVNRLVTLRENARDQVDQFINEYLAANPRVSR